MKPFINISSHAAWLENANIDTDQIIPKQYLKSIKRTGFEDFLFDSWRFKDQGTLDSKPQDREINPDFILNQQPYDTAEILICGKNFGCGSSREHAVWALAGFGIRSVISSSFGDIFYNNALKNGLLPIVLKEAELTILMSLAQADSTLKINIDLMQQKVTVLDVNYSFDIDSSAKNKLIKGLDDIGVTLGYVDKIREYETIYSQKTPWNFVELKK